MIRTLLKTKKEIAQWLDTRRITDYEIQPDLSVDTHKITRIPQLSIENGFIPFNFGVAYATFEVAVNNLITLEGSPHKVMGDFRCHSNKLTSLIGAPRHVEKDFDCDINLLENLIGSPEYVGWSMSCTGNQLTSLKGAPKILGKNIQVGNNMTLKTLEDFDSVLTPGYQFRFDDTQIKELKPFYKNQHMKGYLPFSCLSTEEIIAIRQEQKVLREKEMLANSFSQPNTLINNAKNIIKI